MVKLRLVGAACGAVLVGLCLAASANALGTFNKTAYLTFSGDVALPGVKLTAGTYIFELVSPDTNPTIVRVLSKDRQKVYLMAFTYSTPRPFGTDRSKVIQFGEAARGEAPPIAVWYPADDSSGREFIYHR
jgi:hypothetical protein